MSLRIFNCPIDAVTFAASDSDHKTNVLLEINCYAVPGFTQFKNLTIYGLVLITMPAIVLVMITISFIYLACTILVVSVALYHTLELT